MKTAAPTTPRTEAQLAESIKAQGTLLVANLEALATFAKAAPGLVPSPIYNRERKKALKQLLTDLKELKALGAKKAKKGKVEETSAAYREAYKKWQQTGMALLGKANAAAKKKMANATALKKTYEDWKGSNPTPKKEDYPVEAKA